MTTFLSFVLLLTCKTIFNNSNVGLAIDLFDLISKV